LRSSGPAAVCRILTGFLVAGQKIALGRIHAGQVVAAETITIYRDDQDSRTVRGTTTQPVCGIKAAQPRKAAHVS
jgi:hypothetical protein